MKLIIFAILLFINCYLLYASIVSVIIKIRFPQQYPNISTILESLVGGAALAYIIYYCTYIHLLNV